MRAHAWYRTKVVRAGKQYGFWELNLKGKMPVTKIEDHDHGQAGEVVFYAHGSESMRTYLGLSKLHSTSDCAALKRRGGTIIRDRIIDAAPSQLCKVCHPKLADHPAKKN